MAVSQLSEHLPVPDAPRKKPKEKRPQEESTVAIRADAAQNAAQKLTSKHFPGLDKPYAVLPKKGISPSEPRESELRNKDREQAIVDMLSDLEKPVELTPEKKRGIAYLHFLQDVLSAIKQDPLAFRTDGFKGNVYPPWSVDGRFEDRDDYRGMIASRVDGFVHREADAMLEIFSDTAVISPLKILGSDLFQVVKELHLGFEKSPKTDEALLEMRNAFVKLLRSKEKFDAAEDQIDAALKDDFAPYIQRVDIEWFRSNRISREMCEASDETDAMVDEYKEQWIAKGMTESQMNIARQYLLQMNYERIVRHSIATKNILPVTGAKRELFDQYTEMLALKGGISDKSRSQLQELLLENLPIVIFSAGAGYVVREAVGIAVRRLLLGQGVRLLGGQRVKTLMANQAAKYMGNYIVEQTVGAGLYRVITGNNYENVSEYIQDLFFGLAVRGLLRVGGVALSGSVSLVKTTLEKMKLIIGGITDPQLKMVLDKMIATKNHLGAAITLLKAHTLGKLPQLSKDLKLYLIEQVADTVADTLDTIRIQGSTHASQL